MMSIIYCIVFRISFLCSFLFQALAGEAVQPRAIVVTVESITYFTLRCSFIIVRVRVYNNFVDDIALSLRRVGSRCLSTILDEKAQAVRIVLFSILVLCVCLCFHQLLLPNITFTMYFLKK